MTRKYLMLFLALCLHCAARGQTWQYEYWFDNDRTSLQAGSSASNTFEINANVNNLSENMHAVSIQILGNGTSSYILREVAVEDQSYTNIVVEKMSAQMLSAPVTRYFVKVPVGTPAVRWWIDNETSTSSAATGGTVSLDMNAVKEGFHILHVQPEGDGTPRSYPFLKVLPAPDALSQSDLMECYYAIDGGSFSNKAGTLSNGVYQFDIDVSALTDGLHKISFVLSNTRGVTTNAQTHFFIKIPLGGYGITSYWYWLNEDDENIVKVPVEKANPFTLNTTLLNLAQIPIRSTKFAFGFKDNDISKPAIFAKNDLHMRFFDVSGRFTDLNREYIDERVYYILGDNDFSLLPLLDNNGSCNLSAANSMQWYVISLTQGNSLLLRLDHPATIQVFDSQGNEVYSAEGQESIAWGDITAGITGDYYIVVHDPSTGSTNVTLNYDIISKKGDANGDNDVTIADAITIVRHILGLPNERFVEKAADFNGDTRITIADAVGIVNFVLPGH